MKRRLNFIAGLRAIGFFTLAFWMAGCATSRIDWNSRVGNYTFDQAVIEMGPPDKQATLEDGTIVAEWLVRRGYAHSHPAPIYYSYSPWGYYGPVFPAYVDSYAPDYFIRLTFSPESRLMAWKKFAR